MSLLEYIWLDGQGKARSKTKVMKVSKRWWNLGEVPWWNYDGSSTGQAVGTDSEVLLRPAAIFNDPFREGGENKLVLCDIYLPDRTPHPSNTRYAAVEIFNARRELEPLFGIEQEFFLKGRREVLGFENRLRPPAPQGPYYCGTGAPHVKGRECVEEAFQNCLKAGLSLTGLNVEVGPAQWEFQVCTKGIAASDQLCIMRYILDRTAEKYGWSIELDPKPIPGDWNGSGCHTNFSTKPMREEGGYEVIMDAIKKLEDKHMFHMQYYGAGNKRRLTGAHETSPYDTFTYGVANRGASVRIPRATEAAQCGYLEDRRPASNMDPYVVTSLIFKTTTE